MKPVNQTKFNKIDSEGNFLERSNSFAACVASILEMDLINVPNFETLLGMGNWYYIDVFNDWLWSLEHESVFFEYDSLYENNYIIVFGVSERGDSHHCVYLGGKLAHDPFPGGNGLLAKQQHLFVFKAI